MIMAQVLRRIRSYWREAADVAGLACCAGAGYSLGLTEGLLATGIALLVYAALGGGSHGDTE